MLVKYLCLLQAAAHVAQAVVARQPSLLHTRNGDQPGMPYDPKTTPYCIWWVDNDGSETCDGILSQWQISIDNFIRWNPSITRDCGNLRVGQSYCAETDGEPMVTTSTTGVPTITTTSTTKTSTTSTSTKPSNGISTPEPTQPGLVNNCDAFYMVKRGETCETVAAAHGISVEQFTTWNSKVGKDCTGLWADAYACVSIIGHEPGTPTKPQNGIETPQPSQPGMIPVCNNFYYVKPGQSCVDVAAENGITVADFTSWNTKANDDCSGLWANAYACVSTIRIHDLGSSMPGWSVIDGSFKPNGKALVASSSNGGKALINAQYNDFIYDADITVHNPSGNAGLVFRTTNAGSGADNYRGYYAGIGTDASGYVILGRADRNWNEIKKMKIDIRPGQEYQLRIRASGGRIEVYVGNLGVPKISVQDDTFRKGFNGVRVYQTGAKFENIGVAPLVYDGFEKNMVGWTIHDGGFDASSKSLVASDVFSGKATLNTQFSNFIFDADVSLPKSSGGNAGVLFRATSLGKGPDAYRGYYAGIATNGFLIVGAADGSWRELRRVPVNIRQGQVYHIMITAANDLIMVFLDDMASPKISFNDGTFKHGSVGARVFQAGAIFDNFRVQKLQF